MRVGEHFDFLSHFYSGWDMAKARGMAETLDLKLADRLRELSRGQSHVRFSCNSRHGLRDRDELTTGGKVGPAGA